MYQLLRHSACGLRRAPIEARAEFRRSARNVDAFDQVNNTFRDVCHDVPVPKSVWRWIDSVQRRVDAVGALSVVALLLCGNAAARGR
jgi:hypothetical protein